MTPDDRKPFLEVVIGFAELKGKQLSAPALELYWNSMQHWCIGDFRAAASALITRCEFMPTPKDFEDLRRADDLTAGEAWAAVFEGVGEATQRAWRALDIVTAGRKVSMMNLETEVPHVLRRFLQIYDELTEVENARESFPQLADMNTRTRINHAGFKRLGEIKPEIQR